MTQTDKIAMLESLTGETDRNKLSAYLTLAGQKVIQKCYPFRADVEDVPDKYATVQIEIAVYMLNKRGAEGETYHSENGINRTYESADVPDSMLARVIPFVEVI